MRTDFIDDRFIHDIKVLSLAFAPSGREGEVRNLITEYVTPYADGIVTDKLGNLIVTVQGMRHDRKMMINAHMDEVGFIITEITDDGKLRFSALGGIDTAVLTGKRVTVEGIGGVKIHGVISATPFHLLKKEDREKTPDIDSLMIDIGANNRESTESCVKIGCFATFGSMFYELGDTKIKGKALDDRLGVLLMIYQIMRMKRERISRPFDTVFAFTVKEELGLSGANTAAFSVSPNAAVVLETTAVADIHGVSSEKTVAVGGLGGVISPMDRGTVYPRNFVDAAVSIAEKNGVRCQLKRYVSGGNDSSAISRALDGIPTLAISAPTRYLHSPSCVLDLRDAEEMHGLLSAIIDSEEILGIMKP